MFFMLQSVDACGFPVWPFPALRAVDLNVYENKGHFRCTSFLFYKSDVVAESCSYTENKFSTNLKTVIIYICTHTHTQILNEDKFKSMYAHYNENIWR